MRARRRLLSSSPRQRPTAPGRFELNLHDLFDVLAAGGDRAAELLSVATRTSATAAVVDMNLAARAEFILSLAADIAARGSEEVAGDLAVLPSAGLPYDHRLPEWVETSGCGDLPAAAASRRAAWLVLVSVGFDRLDTLPDGLPEMLGAALILAARAGPADRPATLATLTAARLLLVDAAHAQHRRGVPLNDQHSRLVFLLANLCLRRGRTFNELPSLEAAAACYDDAAAATSDPAALVAVHSNWAMTLLAAHRSGTATPVLDRAVEHARLAAKSADGSNLVSSWLNLGVVLAERASANHTPDDRDEALAAFNTALEHSPGGGERRAELLLGVATLTAAGADAGADELRNSLAMLVNARTEAETDDLRARVDVSLANRYRQLAAVLPAERRPLLAAAIDAGRSAVAAAEHPDVDPTAAATAFNNLAVMLRDRWLLDGDTDSLDESLELQHRAVASLPDRSWDQPVWRSNLANGYRLRWEDRGQPNDLTLARWHASRAFHGVGRDDPRWVTVATTHLVAAAAATGALPAATLESLLDLGRRILDRTAADSPQRPDRVADVAHLLELRYQRSGRVDDISAAVEMLQGASATLAPSAPNRPAILTSLGGALHELSDATGDPVLLTRAAEACREAVTSLPADDPTPPNTQIALTNLAGVLSAIADKSLDVDLLDETVRVCRHLLARLRPGSARRSAVLTTLANALLSRYETMWSSGPKPDLGDGLAAIDAHREALKSVASNDSRYPLLTGNLANALFQVGATALDTALLEESTRWYEESLSGKNAGSAHRELNAGFAALTLAELSEDQKQAAANTVTAREHLHHALNQSASASLETAYRARVGLVRAAAAAGDWGEVRRRAPAIADDLAALARQQASSMFFETQLRLRGELPALVALGHLDATDARAAVDSLETLRGTTLAAELGFERINATIAQAGGMIHVRDDLDALLAQRRTLTRQLAATQHGASSHLAALRELDTQLDELSTRLRGELGADAPGFRGGAAEVTAAAGLLGHRVVYLVAGPHGGAAITVTSDGAIDATAIAGLRSATARRWASSLRAASANLHAGRQVRFSSVLNRVLSECGAIAGTPLAQVIGGGSVTLIPVGPLVDIPWQAVPLPHSPRRRLADIASITYSPTGTQLLTSARRARDAPRSGPAVIVADALVEPRLPRAREEALWIAQRTQSPTLLGADATPSAILSALRSCWLLHVSCHAVERRRAANNALLLTGGEITAAELITHRVHGNRLAVLAACSTARADRAATDEPLGLAPALLAAGCPTVIASLWPVPDDVTATLMTEFYQRWPASEEPAAALRAAQTAIRAGVPGIEPRPHPYYWAAFAVHGAG
jgi:tetratricopeptide (TPR) repeat protein